eukprot:gene17419-23721_t
MATSVSFLNIVLIGAPSTDVIREFDGYVAAFNFRTRNPTWVMEYLTKENLEGDSDRHGSDFVKDKSTMLPTAPAADHKHSQQDIDDTFSMSNVSPQVGRGFNRDYWSQVERFIRELTRSCDEVYIITGPLWLPNLDADDAKWRMEHAMIGRPPSLISVPTHFYKVVVAEGVHSKKGKEAGGRTQMAVGAFVLPNAPIDPSTPLSAFVVPLGDLEAAAGAKFFPDLLTEDKRKIVDAASTNVREQGLRQVHLFERQKMMKNMEVLPAPPELSSGNNFMAATSAVATIAGSSIRAKRSKNVQSTGLESHGNDLAHLCQASDCRLPSQAFLQTAASQKKKKKSKEKQD